MHIFTSSVPYPTFGKLLVYDIVKGELEGQAYTRVFDEFFVLVLDNGYGKSIVSEYYNDVSFGVAYDVKEKMLEIYSKEQAIPIFHELCGKCLE